ncbi:hypothetical protein HAZT_HAZT004680 [Hyalella azteca]|uniref:Dynein light chain Tctex-type 1 n=1 Tax=Hyalella azteca TaxID=294128 RepID=A0A6A0GXV6_HYAAZ|nr:hypothetical protein HAZT_HAZT004680 [Hyalella azteca]
MDEAAQSDENQFVMDEVSAIIKMSVETVIGGNGYTSAKVNGWTAQVVESVLGNLSKLNKSFNDMCDNAEEWSGSTYGLVMLLGQRNRRLMHRTLGEQNYVLIPTVYMK